MANDSWENVSERGNVWAMRLFVSVLNVLGYRTARILLPVVVSYFYLTGSKSRMASMEYLKNLKRFDPGAPEPGPRAVFRHHHEFAINMLDRVLLWQGRTQLFQFSGTGRGLVADAERPGSLIVGSHLGSFDLLRVIALEFDRKVHVVMHRSHAQRINSLLNALNPDADLHVVEIAPDDLEGVMRLKKCVENGDHIAILADRQQPGGRGRNCRIPFLGEEVGFPESPWALAELLRCPVLMATAVRIGDCRYEITVECITDRVQMRHPGGNRKSTAALESYVHRLESLCCKHPFQWFNFFDFWEQNPGDGLD